MMTNKKTDINKCLNSSKTFFTAMTFSSYNVLKCVSMSNQECKVRPVIMNIKSNEPLFYPYSVPAYKYSGKCNINDAYTKMLF